MRRHRQKGFTLIELIISVAIVAILASISLDFMRDYTRRAKVSEVMMLLSKCKHTVAENYLTRDSVPLPGTWGCEGSGGSPYAGVIETSSDGVIRVTVDNLDRGVNGRFIHMAPARADGATAMTTANDLGRGVGAWICGSNWLLVRNALPANCRTDTTSFADLEFR